LNIGIGYDFHENYVTLAMERNEALSGGRKMAKEFTVIIEQDEEGYFIAEVPELKGCHTQAKSLDTLIKRIKEAIQLCLEVQGEEPPRTHLVGVQKVAV